MTVNDRFLKSVEALLSPMSRNARKYAELTAARFVTPSALAEASHEMLTDILDGNARLALYIRISCILAARRVTDRFKFSVKHTKEEILEYFRVLLSTASVETVYIMSFDASGRAIACDFAGEGTVNYSSVFPRRLLEIALKRKASSVVFAHNHPGGLTRASQEDMVAIGILTNMFETSGISVDFCCITASGGCHAV